MKAEMPQCPYTQVPNGLRLKPCLGLWVLGCLGICILGCGPSRPTTIPVRGTVTFNGGPPPAEGMITFPCIEPAPGFDRRPGRARFDTSGKYSATSFVDGDGLVPGTYRVRVECWKVAPSMEAQASPDSQGVSYIAEGFEPPTITVDDSLGTFNINVPLAE